MRKTIAGIAVGCCLIAAVSASAQGARKAGLWESTSTMTWQQSPMPAGMTMPAGSNSPFGGAPHTTQVCVTQAQIDKYGTPPPQSRNNQCQMSNMQIKAGGMSADWVCTGTMAGKGSVESTWSDSDHATTKVHFAGSMQMGPNSRPIEYTMQVTSVFKSADCGSVKPIEIPSK